MIELNVSWIALFVLIGIIVFLIHSGFNINLFVKKDIHAKDCDSDIVQDLISKFPLVSPEFMQKTIKEQSIENNQEIHQINKALISLQKDINEIRRIQNGGL
jgi:hypothetical protein